MELTRSTHGIFLFEKKYALELLQDTGLIRLLNCRSLVVISFMIPLHIDNLLGDWYILLTLDQISASRLVY